MPTDLSITLRNDLERNIEPLDNDENFQSIKAWAEAVYPVRAAGVVSCSDYYLLPSSGPRAGYVTVAGIQTSDIVLIRQLVDDPTASGEWQVIGGIKIVDNNGFFIYTNGTDVSTWNYIVLTPTTFA